MGRTVGSLGGEAVFFVENRGEDDITAKKLGVLLDGERMGYYGGGVIFSDYERTRQWVFLTRKRSYDNERPGRHFVS